MTIDNPPVFDDPVVDRLRRTKASSKPPRKQVARREFVDRLLSESSCGEGSSREVVVEAHIKRLKAD